MHPNECERISNFEWLPFIREFHWRVPELPGTTGISSIFLNASPHASIWWNECLVTRRVEAKYGNVSVAKMLMRFLFICCLHYDLPHAVMCMTTHCRSIRSCILALRLEISCHHFFLQRRVVHLCIVKKQTFTYEYYYFPSLVCHVTSSHDTLRAIERREEKKTS